jgi:hypothetical protein
VTKRVKPLTELGAEGSVSKWITACGGEDVFCSPSVENCKRQKCIVGKNSMHSIVYSCESAEHDQGRKKRAQGGEKLRTI